MDGACQRVVCIRWHARWDTDSEGRVARASRWVYSPPNRPLVWELCTARAASCLTIVETLTVVETRRHHGAMCSIRSAAYVQTMRFGTGSERESNHARLDHLLRGCWAVMVLTVCTGVFVHRCRREPKSGRLRLPPFVEN